MSNMINNILGVIFFLARIAVGLYVLYYLLGNIHNPNAYPLEKMQWFMYMFIWDIWVTISTNKLSEETNE